MQHLKTISFLVSLFFFTFSGFAQDTGTVEDETRYVQAEVIDGDTIPVVTLKEALVDDRRRGRSRKYQRIYDRMKPKVVEVYPYAKVAGMLFREYDQKLEEMNTDVKRKYYMKKVEEELKKEFKGEITDLTVSEGRVLIKLIDRETGNTSFEVIKDLRGGFSAFFWQSLARVFGSNLKEGYDSNNKDRIIEDIVLDIEMGKIEMPEREPKTQRVKDVLEDSDDRGRWWKLNS